MKKDKAAAGSLSSLSSSSSSSTFSGSASLNAPSRPPALPLPTRIPERSLAQQQSLTILIVSAALIFMSSIAIILYDLIIRRVSKSASSSPLKSSSLSSSTSQPSALESTMASTISTQGKDAGHCTFQNDEGTRKRKRDWLLERQEKFQHYERAGEELRCWKQEREPEGGFRVLNGLVPEAIVGKMSKGAQKPWRSVDTFFSEFAKHNPEYMILSDSEPSSPTKGSLIIANHSTHDSRQYPPWLEKKYALKLNGTPTTPEGQAFGHILVIPKRRIFNVVDPEATSHDCAFLREHVQHFEAFWSVKSNRQKLLERMRTLFEAQNDVLLVTQYPEAEAVVKATRRDFEALKPEFEKLGREDFVVGVHPWDTNSVGHLHVHVFPKDGKFRIHSAVRHDGKTVPVEDVLAAQAGGRLENDGEGDVEMEGTGQVRQRRRHG